LVDNVMRLRLVSVNVGQPKQIGMRDGAPVLSAIAKTPVAQPRIAVGTLGLAGDAQANLLVHGGIDKAVYAYPEDNWPWWESERGLSCFPGRFGENLTLEGADETAVSIGDRFAWGDAILEISQPRSPCHKFQLYTGQVQAGAWMTLSGRCGWYLRVVREGEAPAGGNMERIFASGGPNVRETFMAAFNRKTDEAIRARIAAYPALAEAWRLRFMQGDEN